MIKIFIIVGILFSILGLIEYVFQDKPYYTTEEFKKVLEKYKEKGELPPTY